MENCVAELQDQLIERDKYTSHNYRNLPVIDKLKQNFYKFFPKNGYECSPEEAQDVLNKIITQGQRNNQKPIEFSNFYYNRLNKQSINHLVEIQINFSSKSIEPSISCITDYENNANYLIKESCLYNNISYNSSHKSNKTGLLNQLDEACDKDLVCHLSSSKPRHIHPENKFFIHKVLQEGAHTGPQSYDTTVTTDTRKSSRAFKPSRIVRDILEDITFADNSSFKSSSRFNINNLADTDNNFDEEFQQSNTLMSSSTPSHKVPGVYDFGDKLPNAVIMSDINNAFKPVLEPKLMEKNRDTRMTNTPKSQLQLDNGCYTCPHGPCKFHSTCKAAIFRHITLNHKNRAISLPPNAKLKHYYNKGQDGCFTCKLAGCYYESIQKISIIKHMVEFHNGSINIRKNGITHDSHPTHPSSFNGTPQRGPYEKLATAKSFHEGDVSGVGERMEDSIENVVLGGRGPTNGDVLDGGHFFHDNYGRYPVFDRRSSPFNHERRRGSPRVKYVSRKRETVYPIATFPDPSDLDDTVDALLNPLRWPTSYASSPPSPYYRCAPKTPTLIGHGGRGAKPIPTKMFELNRSREVDTVTETEPEKGMYIGNLSALPLREKEKLIDQWNKENETIHHDEIPAYQNGSLHPSLKCKNPNKHLNHKPSNTAINSSFYSITSNYIRVRWRKLSIPKKNRSNKPISKIFAPLLDKKDDPVPTNINDHDRGDGWAVGPESTFPSARKWGRPKLKKSFSWSPSFPKNGFLRSSSVFFKRKRGRGRGRGSKLFDLPSDGPPSWNNIRTSPTIADSQILPPSPFPTDPEIPPIPEKSDSPTRNFLNFPEPWSYSEDDIAYSPFLISAKICCDALRALSNPTSNYVMTSTRDIEGDVIWCVKDLIEGVEMILSKD